MEIRYIDIHSHLNLSPLKESRDEILDRMKEKGVATITVGTGLETSKEAISIAHAHKGMCFATIGIHPSDFVEADTFDKVAELASNESVVAIGETGLDYFRLPEDENERVSMKKEQKILFKKHIDLAVVHNKPLMIHARPSKGNMDAYHDVLDMLEGKEVRANFHFFAGDVSVAERIIRMSHTASFDGPITFARDYDEVLRLFPLTSLMTETDAPFAAPVPYRGRTCEPWMVEEVYKKIAEIRGEDEEVVRVQLIDNTKKFFGISF